MSKKKKGSHKKSTAEYQDYRNFITNSVYSPESTIPVHNEMLQGSSEYSNNDEEINSSDNIKKTPIKYRISDWIRKNVFPTIITTLCIAIGSAVIAHQVNISVINKQIEYIEKKIEQIDSDTVEKEVLDLKLQEIVTEMNSSFSISFNDVKWQLKELEEKIDSIDANR